MTNIAVVVLDTLRYDRFKEYFPWLNGIRFENAYSTSHWTLPAHSSLFSGLYPSEAGVSVNSRTFTCEQPTLAESLQGAGYTTRMIASNVHFHTWEGWDRGFTYCIGPDEHDISPTTNDLFDWKEYASHADISGAQMYAAGILECLRSESPTIRSIQYGYWLKSNTLMSSASIRNRLRTMTFGDDEFLFVNVMDTHAPYYSPKRYRETDQKYFPSLQGGLAGQIDNPGAVRRAYDGCVSYLSDVYRDMFARLREDFDYIITLGDHGEHLGEQGLWTHAYGLGQEITHIPLVISSDDILSETVSDVVSVLDIHQTVADLAGATTDSRGQNLLDNRQPLDRLIEYHGLAEKRKEMFEEYGIKDQFEPMNNPLNAIISPDGYAAETHGEGLNVFGGWSEDEAQDRLDDLLDTRNPATDIGKEGEISDDVQDRLEYLGYA